MQLGISVSAANILLWVFTEVFIICLTFNLTRLYASRQIYNKLEAGGKIAMPSTLSLIDRLPYNQDLLLLNDRTKLALTVVRFCVVIISFYLGSILNGAVRRSRHSFDVRSAIEISSLNATKLSKNFGNDIAAMAKLSCLRILNNNHVVLYKGYIASDEDIVCEDGLVTYSINVLASAQIRTGKQTPETGISMEGMNILNVSEEDESSVDVSSLAIVYRERDDVGKYTGEQVRIVLNKRTENGLCQFGLERSAGGNFQIVVNLQVTTTCMVQIVDYSRLIKPKPDFLPPRMSFLYHVLDATVVRVNETVPPVRKGSLVEATLTVTGLCVGVSVALVSSLTTIFYWCSMRRKTKLDITSAKGMANLWLCEKFGLKPEESSSDNMFISLDKQRKCPYLESSDFNADTSYLPDDMIPDSIGFSKFSTDSNYW